MALEHTDVQQAFAAGRRAGFGLAAVVMSGVAFLNLLSAEKAIVAIVFGLLAVRGAAAGSQAKRLGTAAVAIGIVFLLMEVVLLAFFWEELAEFVRMLDKLA